MKVLKKSLIILTLIAISPWSMATVDNGPVIPGIKLHVERVGNMTHFEFQGKKEWDYDLVKKDSVIHITVPKLKTASLDAIQEYKGLLIESIKVDHSIENKTKLMVQLIDKRVESFDYLTQDPSNLVVDFFVSDDSLIDKIKADKIAAKKPKKKKAKVVKAGPISARNPAFAEFFEIQDDKASEAEIEAENNEEFSLKPLENFDELFDFGSLVTQVDDDLEEKVIEAKGNIYLRFPLLKLKNRYLQELQSFRPEYEIKRSFSDENKQARFLLKLFDQRSYASFIKAKQIYRKNFPVSKYDEILTYIEADVWVELWKKNNRVEYLTKAMNLYRMLIERYPNSRISERTLIHAGLLSHDVGEFFLATKMLKRYLKNYPGSPFGNYVRIYLADALAHLNNYEGARSTLDKVIEDGEEGSKQEAMFRVGDIYFLKQSYRRAERAYAKAIEKFPKDVKSYPNALFNKAESHFVLAEYTESLKAYKEFFDKYPGHPYGGYALTRVGEIIQILGASNKRAQGFYNESFFRYRKTTGGVIARMRSLSQRFKDMKKKELATSIDEIKKIEKEINLYQVDEFAAFMISDGFYQRGDFMEAANALIDYFQINPKPVNIKKFERRISRAIAGEVRKLILKGDAVKAIGIIESHQKSWLSKSRRVDVQYFRAMAYEKMGLFDEALESYNRLKQRMKLLVGSKEEKERKVFEYYPTIDQVNLREAVASYGLNKNSESLAYLKEIKNVKALDNLSKVDYHLTLSKLSYDNKKYDSALKTVNLVKADDIKDPVKKEKFNVYLSQVYEKNGKFDKAIDILENHYKKHKGERDQVYILSRLYKLYQEMGMTDKAIATGDRLLTEYDTKYDLDKERYYLGEMHYQKNDRKTAEKVWKGLTKKSMWAELAKNKVSGDEWKKETDESIKRIPAMAR
ncbi:MAG: tetratricopeptide repeat protein [Bdellovibrionales bacterium]|nr:tetratricopeptide repeat protein [Bdellovibrionales bacterium]